MATGTRGIATRADANIKKFGAYTTDLTRCITYASAVSAGFTVSGTYATNQLVKYSDLSAPLLIFKLTVNLSDSAVLYEKGPITLNTSGFIGNIIKYSREVEATEVEEVEQNASVNGMPLEYSMTHIEESDASVMPLSTIDEVLQVAQEFEEQDQILRAAIATLGVTLTKDNSTTNLLDSSTYGPSSVVSKKVTFTLFSKTYTSSDAGTYKLSYAGNNTLKNKDGLYPLGQLYASSTSSNQYETMTVSNAGTYVFNAYWKTTSVPDPSTPTATTWKLYFRVRVSTSLRWHQVRVALTNWKLLDYNGNTCLSGNLPYTYYTASQMEMDMMHANSTIDDGYSVYVIPLGSYTEATGKGEPAYIAYDTLSANSYTPYNGGALCMSAGGIDNTMTNGALNAGADRAIIFSDISTSKRVYVSVYYDALPGSDFEEPGPIRPIV